MHCILNQTLLLTIENICHLLNGTILCSYEYNPNWLRIKKLFSPTEFMLPCIQECIPVRVCGMSSVYAIACKQIGPGGRIVYSWQVATSNELKVIKDSLNCTAGQLEGIESITMVLLKKILTELLESIPSDSHQVPGLLRQEFLSPWILDVVA